MRKSLVGRYLGSALLSMVLTAAGVICVFRWRSERTELQAALQSVFSALRAADSRMAALSLELGNLRLAVHSERKDLLAAVQALPGALLQPSPTEPPSPEVVEGPGTAFLDGELSENPADELPAIPERVLPERAFKKTLGELLKDAELNPDAKTLDRVGFARVGAEYARTRWQIEALEGDINLAIAEGVEKQRAEGRYIEYARGEAYQDIPGALTVGEEMLGGGVRMFYFLPDEFPDVFEKRSEKQQVATLGLQRILKTLQGLE